MEWQRQIRQVLSPMGLTHVQFVYLACLSWLSSQGEKHITQGQLATFATLDKMVVSETTKKLLEKNLIERDEHQHDSRAYCIVITANAKRLVNKALPLVEAVDAQFFDRNAPMVKSLIKR